MYEPLKVFTYLGLAVLGIGVAISVRFLFYYFTEVGFGPERHLQSLIASAVLMIVGFQVIVIGLLADMISGNRKLLEDVLYRVRKLELPQAQSHREQTPVHGSAQNDRWGH